MNAAPTFRIEPGRNWIRSDAGGTFTIVAAPGDGVPGEAHGFRTGARVAFTVTGRTIRPGQGIRVRIDFDTDEGEVESFGGWVK